MSNIDNNLERYNRVGIFDIAFEKNIKINKIESSGDCNDCYFFSAISGIGKFEDFILNDVKLVETKNTRDILKAKTADKLLIKSTEIFYKKGFALKLFTENLISSFILEHGDFNESLIKEGKYSGQEEYHTLKFSNMPKYLLPSYIYSLLTKINIITVGMSSSSLTSITNYSNKYTIIIFLEKKHYETLSFNNRVLLKNEEVASCMKAIFE